MAPTQRHESQRPAAYDPPSTYNFGIDLSNTNPCTTRLTPNVQDDLKNFHRQHFPSAPVPDPLAHVFGSGDQSTGDPFLSKSSEEAYNYEEDEEEDDLGYYPDGVKRTLTDEQIAMFRHSEIQALLRERRLAEEADEEEDGEIPNAEAGKKRSWAATGAASTDGWKDGKRKKKRKKRPSKQQPGPGGSAQARTSGDAKDIAADPPTSDMQEQDDTEEDFTPRRVARELDEVQAVSIDIDYG